MSVLTLWPAETTDTLLWCLDLWSGCCNLTSIQGWQWQTSCFCKQDTISIWEEILIARQRSTLHCFWDKEIPAIPTRKTLHYNLRSKTSSVSVWWEQTNSCFSICKNQKMGLILSAHDNTIEYQPGQQHGNTDVLSRLPLPVTEVEEEKSTRRSSPLNGDSSKYTSGCQTDSPLDGSWSNTVQCSKISADWMERYSWQEAEAIPKQNYELSVQDSCSMGKLSCHSWSRQKHYSVGWSWWTSRNHNYEAANQECGVVARNQLWHWENGTNLARRVQCTRNHLPLLLCTPGNGQGHLGHDYTLTMPDHLWERCS